MSSLPSPVSSSTLLNRLLARTRLRQLQLLVLTAELGSIQRAAEASGMSQPSVTKAVAELERLVDTRLFERHARGVRPTYACRDLLPLLRNMMGALTNCAESLAASLSGVQGVIRIGAISAGITGLLGEALPSFLARFPQLRVEVIEDTRDVLQSRFADGTLDLVLVREPSSLAVGCRFVPLLDDHVVVVAAPGHPMLRRREVHPRQLLEQTWALPPLDSQLHAAFERLFEDCGSQPSYAPLVTRSLPMLLLFLRSERALALVPVSNIRPFVAAGLVQMLNLKTDDTLPPVGLLVAQAPAKQGVALLCTHLENWLHSAPSAASGRSRSAR